MKFQYIIIFIISSCINQGRDSNNQQIQIAESISNNKVKSEINFTDGKGLKQGFWKINDSVNNEIREVYYKDNQLDSISKKIPFLPKGQIIIISFFSKWKDTMVSYA